MADAIAADLRPDFYIAAIGRSGSTMLCNWLSEPPKRIVFNEPFFLRPANSRLLRIQLRNLGLEVSEQEWTAADRTPPDRFRRIMGPRLEGRRWAAKEVLCDEHLAMTRTFAPPRVLVTVRDLEQIALSFFEKHRLQDNLDRFSDDWVRDYCLRESAGILSYLDVLAELRIPSRIVRYEDFIASEAERAAVADFVGWPGGGDVAANLEDFDRGFEVRRHGRSFGTQALLRATLPAVAIAAAREIAECSPAYQKQFGYRPSN